MQFPCLENRFYLSPLQQLACGGPLLQFLSGTGNSTANDALDDDLRAQVSGEGAPPCLLLLSPATPLRAPTLPCAPR